MSELTDRIRRALPYVPRGEARRLRRELARLTDEVANLRSGLASLRTQVQDTCDSNSEALHWLIERMMQLVVLPEDVPVPNDENYSFDECLAKLEQLAPRAYPVWREAFDAGTKAYEGLPTHSCSVSGHRVAERFRRFLWPYLKGTALDIGCGPQAVPLYLVGRQTEFLAGLDPLPPAAPHPFTFVRGVAEFLPWDADTFQVVIAATSLDHVLLLDRTLEEICRVLKPHGHFVTWVSFVPGAKPYDPHAEVVAKIDDYHLFHFDRPWFLELMERYFAVQQEFQVDAQSSFWCFRKR